MKLSPNIFIVRNLLKLSVSVFDGQTGNEMLSINSYFVVCLLSS